MAKPVVGVVAASLTLMMLSGCADDWQERRINLVEVDGSRLRVGSHCHDDARVRAEETDERVELTFQVRGGYRGDCYDIADVVLDEELGDRTLIDAATGEAVEIGTHG